MDAGGGLGRDDLEDGASGSTNGERAEDVAAGEGVVRHGHATWKRKI